MKIILVSPLQNQFFLCQSFANLLTERSEVFVLSWALFGISFMYVYGYITPQPIVKFGINVLGTKVEQRKFKNICLTSLALHRDGRLIDPYRSYGQTPCPLLMK